MKRTGLCPAMCISFTVVAAVVAILLSILTDSGLVGSHHPLATPKEGQVRVACVGDSLTYGFGIPDHDRSNYPALLQNLLGDGYCVSNYGYSGRTVSPEGDRPYTKENLYNQSKDFAPQIVVLMLGSNDTKPYNWVSDEYYLQQYQQIAESYLALDSVQTLVLMAPTPVFAANGKVPYHIDQAIIDRLPTLVRQLYDTLASTYNNVIFVNLYPLFEGKPQLFSDGAHPTKVGAGMIAYQVYNAIVE